MPNEGFHIGPALRLRCTKLTRKHTLALCILDPVEYAHTTIAMVTIL